MRKAIHSPYAVCVFAFFDPLRSIAFGTVFGSLDGLDHLNFVHTIRINSYVFCHAFDIVKSHVVLS